MAFKISHILLFILLWLSIILLFLFHEYHHHFKAKIYNNNNNHIMHSSSHDQKNQDRSMSRKVLANKNYKFDFSPFFKNHHQLHHQHLQPPDTEIDPRYGVEKRRVPTGPNPLHH